MTNKASCKALEGLLAQIHESLLESMLADLRDPSKHTPALYSAIIKELDRNGIDITPKAGDGDSILAQLTAEVKKNMEDSYGDFN